MSQNHLAALVSAGLIISRLRSLMLLAPGAGTAQGRWQGRVAIGKALRSPFGAVMAISAIQLSPSTVPPLPVLPVLGASLLWGVTGASLLPHPRCRAGDQLAHHGAPGAVSTL